MIGRPARFMLLTVALLGQTSGLPAQTMMGLPIRPNANPHAQPLNPGLNAPGVMVGRPHSLRDLNKPGLKSAPAPSARRPGTLLHMR